jgi:hypothetical protein
MAGVRLSTCQQNLRHLMYNSEIVCGNKFQTLNNMAAIQIFYLISSQEI